MPASPDALGMKDFFGAKGSQQTTDPGRPWHRKVLPLISDIPRHPFVHSALILIPLLLSVFVMLHLLESKGIPMTRSFRLSIDARSENSGNASLYSPLASAFRVALPLSDDILNDNTGVSTLPSCAELFFAKR